MPVPRASKYRNKKTEAGFDSKKEEKRWHELCLLQRAGVISGLEQQKRYNLIVNGAKICTYVADFAYLEKGVHVTEDVKSEFTRKNPVYRIKYKLMQACLGITIKET